MSERAANTSLKMPVLAGVVIAGRAFARTYLKGRYILDESQSRQVEKLFVDSARFTGHQPPEDFALMAGEIFYEERKIVEIRLTGALTPIKKKGMLTSHPRWHLGGGPKFDINPDFSLSPAPQDRGRAYVVAMKHERILFLS
jgi:hypothetical protein